MIDGCWRKASTLRQSARGSYTNTTPPNEWEFNAVIHFHRMRMRVGQLFDGDGKMGSAKDSQGRPLVRGQPRLCRSSLDQVGKKFRPTCFGKGSQKPRIAYPHGHSLEVREGGPWDAESLTSTVYEDRAVMDQPVASRWYGARMARVNGAIHTPQVNDCL